MYKDIYMKKAVDLSSLSMNEGTGGPFGAIIVKDGQIVGQGRNLVTVNNDPTAHAEVVAIRDACQHLGTFQLEGCDIYCSCEPCPMCLGAIYWARPRHIYFAATREDAALAGFDDSLIYQEIPKKPTERLIPTEQKDQQLAVTILRRWKNFENKIEY